MLDVDDEHTFSATGKWSPEVLKHGFTIVPNLLISSRRQLGLTPTELYIFIALDSYRWDNWHAPFPSLDTLANQTGLHRQTVHRATNKLERSGLIHKSQRFGQSNLYDLRPADEELMLVTQVNNGV